MKKNENKDMWKTVLGEIEVQISRPNFLTWLKQSQLVDKDEKEGLATVGLPNNFAKEWVKNRYHKLILGSLRSIDGSIKKIDYIVVNTDDIKTKQKDYNSNKKTKGSSNIQSSLIETKIDPKTNLNPRYTMDNFVVGSSNELAHAAAGAVIESVGNKYNPLFIYGKVGLGKTHLIQAVGNEIIIKHENEVKVLYVTSEQFINDVVGAIRNKRMEDTKKKYRSVDVLIIDDIQFIGGKTTTEQEFFYTFNALYEQNKQIILSSDRPPAAIPKLEERLRSRFEGGMIADVTYPEYEMRLAILKNIVDMNGWSMDESILEFMASKIQRNVRELEGVLNKVMFYTEYKKEKVNEELLEQIINETSRVSSRNITPEDIINTVSESFDVPKEQMESKSRKKDIVEPRQVCMYLMRDLLKLSYPHIGEKMGKRDHTTAIHACEKIEENINKNSGLNQKIMLIKESLYK